MVVDIAGGARRGNDVAGGDAARDGVIVGAGVVFCAAAWNRRDAVLLRFAQHVCVVLDEVEVILVALQRLNVRKPELVPDDL